MLSATRKKKEIEMKINSSLPGFPQGGIKAVLWTDCFQVVMMFAGSMTLINQVSHKMSAERVWDSAKRTNRILFLE